MHCMWLFTLGKHAVIMPSFGSSMPEKAADTFKTTLGV